MISNVTGWYDDDATYEVDASRRSARPAAFSASAISARAASRQEPVLAEGLAGFQDGTNAVGGGPHNLALQDDVHRAAAPVGGAFEDVLWRSPLAFLPPSTYGATGTLNASAAASDGFLPTRAPGPANASPGRLAALPDHSAFNNSSLDSGGASLNVSTTLRTFARSRRARWIRARTIRLNVSPETAKARVATPSRSPFSETTRALVR